MACVGRVSPTGQNLTYELISANLTYKLVNLTYKLANLTYELMIT